MRKISSEKIRETVSALCIEANISLRRDILDAIKRALAREKKRIAKDILRELIENAAIAKREKLPICQDTGAAIVYCEIGQNVLITGDDLARSINRGVSDGYRKGYLRKSIVESPLDRKNTGTNTPAVIHTTIVPGDKIKISVCPKGFGSENKSKIRMFNPTASIKEIKEFILDVVKECGPEACPPLVLGIGLGGTFEKSAELAKAALLRAINRKNPDKDLDRLEKELLGDINALNIGPMGMGGKTTALGVNILTFPTHIAGLPVAVCVSCHATRGSEKTI
ncbi:MAG: fumarate hydratase [Candidatus Omnitrophota bacterium]